VETGVFQGGADSGDNFNLGSFPTAQRVDDIARSGGGRAHAYADDLNAWTRPHQAAEIARTLLEEGPKVGLNPNIGKFKVLLPETFDRANDDAAREAFINIGVPDKCIITHPYTHDHDQEDWEGDVNGLYGHMINGIPIGSPEFVKRELSNVVKQLSVDFEDVKRLKDSQQQYHLETKVLSAKVTHLLRQLLPKDGMIVATAYDKLQREALAHMCEKESISDIEMAWARLPTSEGGLGMADLVAIVKPAFTACYIATLATTATSYPEVMLDIAAKIANSSYTSNSPAVEALFDAVAEIGKDTPHITMSTLLEWSRTDKVAKLQKKLTAGVERARTRAALSEIAKDPIAETIRLSCRGTQASAWLYAQVRGGTKMTSPQFANSLRNRLAMSQPAIRKGMHCACKRKEPIDSRGIHLIKCKLCHSMTVRTHDGVKAVIASLGKAAGEDVKIEQTDLFQQIDPTKNLRADIVLLSGSRTTVLDVRHSHPVDIECERGTSNRPPKEGEMAGKIEHDKQLKYEDKCKQAGMAFRVCALETGGKWGGQLSDLVKMLVKKQARGCDTPFSTLLNYWTQMISVALQKHVSNAQLSRLSKLAAINYLDREQDPFGEEILAHAQWSAGEGRQEGVDTEELEP
jgi:hypothetical protein